LKTNTSTQDTFAIFKSHIEFVFTLNIIAQFVFATLIAQHQHFNHHTVGVKSLKSARLTARMKFKRIPIGNVYLGEVMGEHRTADSSHFHL
jgi:hypothetical protein